MRSVSRLSIAELRASLLEVVDICPAERCNPCDCPLFGLRKLPREERLQWIDALSEDDLTYLAAYHHVCMSAKTPSPAALNEQRA